MHAWSKEESRKGGDDKTNYSPKRKEQARDKANAVGSQQTCESQHNPNGHKQQQKAKIVDDQSR